MRIVLGVSGGIAAYKACLLLRRFTEAGVHVAFGHSDADEAQTREALDWGADIVTHLFNAMRPIHHRDAGPVPVLLTDERCMVELICDGVHHAPVIARMSIDAAGIDRVAMVTDAMSATGKGNGRYLLGDLEVDVLDGTARLVTEDGSAGAIATGRWCRAWLCTTSTSSASSRVSASISRR